MDGFLPFTKSFASDVKVCPWKAYQHKVNRIKSVSGRAAQIGSKVHETIAAIRKGEYTLQQFLDEGSIRQLSSFDPPEHDDIIRMVKMAFYTDPWQVTEL